MKKLVPIIIGCVLVVLLGLAIVLIPRLITTPEISNVEDLSLPTSEAAPPAFFVSDRALLDRTEHKIEAQVSDEATGEGLEGAPYFVEVENGQYAFGYTDSRGYTQALFTPTKQSFQVYWYDEALKEMEGSASGRADQSGARRGAGIVSLTILRYLAALAGGALSYSRRHPLGQLHQSVAAAPGPA